MSKPPILNFAILCDEVTTERGKYTFKGLFDCIWAKDFPASHKSSFIVTRWSNGCGENFKEHILIKEEGSREIIFNSKPFVKPFSLSDLKQTHTIVGHMTGLVFKKAGNYVLEIYLNDVKQETEIRFVVKKAEVSIPRALVSGTYPNLSAEAIGGRLASGIGLSD